MGWFGPQGECGCCAPCCARVWDYLRAIGSTVTLDFNGTTGGLAPSNPMTETKGLYEYIAGPFGALIYQCFEAINHNEQWDGVTTPATGPRRDTAYRVGATFFYAQARVRFQVMECNPLEFEAEARCYYKWISDVDPTATLTGLGYTLDPTWAPPNVIEDRYYINFSDRVDEVLVRTSFLNGVTPFWECWIDVRYLVTYTSGPDITAMPNPLTVQPTWNPHPMSTVITIA